MVVGVAKAVETAALDVPFEVLRGFVIGCAYAKDRLT